MSARTVQLHEATLKGNAVRGERREIRDRLREPARMIASRAECAAVVLEDSAALKTLPVSELLGWVWRSQALDRAYCLRYAFCTEFTPFGDLSARQRGALAEALTLSLHEVRERVEFAGAVAA